jgi:hypothetical protein
MPKSGNKSGKNFKVIYVDFGITDTNAIPGRKEL